MVIPAKDPLRAHASEQVLDRGQTPINVTYPQDVVDICRTKSMYIRH